MADKINEIVPGRQLSEEEKSALTKSNIEASSEAQRLAAEHRARDMAEKGNEKPLAQSVADSIKDKLVREDFQKPV